MGLPQEILDVLKTPIYIERYLGKDEFGNPTYSPSELVMAAISTITRRRGAPHPRPDMIGTMTEFTTQIIVDYGNFSPFDRVTLSGNRRPTVVSVDTGYDEAGDPFYQHIIVEESRK